MAPSFNRWYCPSGETVCPPILQNCIIATTNWNDPVNENEMGRECSRNGREEACIRGFGGKARGKETTGKT
jgi:hypothetical protein